MGTITFAENSSLHWYRVTIVAGNTTATFTSSSRLDSGDLEARIESDQIILIENQRDVVERPGESEMHMPPVAEGEKLFRGVFAKSSGLIPSPLDLN